MSSSKAVPGTSTFSDTTKMTHNMITQQNVAKKATLAGVFIFAPAIVTLRILCVTFSRPDADAMIELSSSALATMKPADAIIELSSSAPSTIKPARGAAIRGGSGGIAI
jgi:hypothetical protein